VYPGSVPTLKSPKIEQNRPESPRTESGTSGSNMVRTWLGTLLKVCTRSVPEYAQPSPPLWMVLIGRMGSGTTTSMQYKTTRYGV
jgi:hypothetical protein